MITWVVSIGNVPFWENIWSRSLSRGLVLMHHIMSSLDATACSCTGMQVKETYNNARNKAVFATWWKIHLNKYKVAVSLLFIFFTFYMTLIHYHVRSQLAHFGIGLWSDYCRKLVLGFFFFNTVIQRVFV